MLAACACVSSGRVRGRQSENSVARHTDSGTQTKGGRRSESEGGDRSCCCCGGRERERSRTAVAASSVVGSRSAREKWKNAREAKSQQRERERRASERRKGNTRSHLTERQRRMLRQQPHDNTAPCASSSSSSSKPTAAVFLSLLRILIPLLSSCLPVFRDMNYSILGPHTRRCLCPPVYSTFSLNERISLSLFPLRSRRHIHARTPPLSPCLTLPCVPRETPRHWHRFPVERERERHGVEADPREQEQH